ncbi:MAG: AMP-binding protein [Thermoguttaceae bacterium]
MMQTPFTPAAMMVANLKKFPNKLKIADSTGASFTGGDTLLRSLVLRRLLRRHLTSREENVGILLPTSCYGVLANAALALDRRTLVNLNYTLGSDALNYCIGLTEIQHIITSRKFLERFPKLKLNAKLLVLEDIITELTFVDKLAAKAESMMPASCLIRYLGLHRALPNDTLTIVFTSGSTGEPKGAMLTHENIATNVSDFCKWLHVTEHDTILGILPFFHVFGFSVCLWFPMMFGLTGVYHFSPLEPKKVGEMSRKYNCNVMASTATFQRSYLRACPPEDFATMKTIVCGAEKLPQDLVEAWQKKFNTEIVEGYGTTELSPVVAASVDDSRSPDAHLFRRKGAVGRPLSSVKVKVVHPESGDDLPPNTSGLLMVKGPTVMKGYYKRPDKTAEVMRDGWYNTGDMAKIDEDNFIFITGRQSRISKIGGEMVPHILIEEMISKIIERRDDATPDGGLRVAVTAVPDTQKGEKIVVLYRNTSLTPDEICHAMRNEAVPNLWIPSPNNFKIVDEIPVLGTGKLDLRRIKELALELCGA